MAQHTKTNTVKPEDSEISQDWVKLAPGHYGPDTPWNLVRPSHGNKLVIRGSEGEREQFPGLIISIPSKGKPERQKVRRYGTR